MTWVSNSAEQVEHFGAAVGGAKRESSSVLLIRGEKNHSAAFIATLPDDGRDPAGAQPALVLNEVEGKYQLTGVWESSREGWDVVREYR